MTLRKLIVAVHAASALVLMMLFGLACGADPGAELPIDEVALEESPSNALQPSSGEAMSPAMQAAHLRALQLEGGPSYALEPQSSGLAFAVGRSAAQRIGLRFLAGSVEVQLEGANAAHSVELELTAVGRGNAQMEAPKLTALPEVDGAEVRYARGEALTEWYLNGPQGLEQGFELEERPLSGEGELSLTIAVRGSLEAQLRGSTVALVDAQGAVRARYGKLFVSDADGEAVPSRLDVDGAGNIVMRIDDALARYPLMVDPLLWLEQQKLTSDAESDDFGSSVSVSGDTALVGAPYRYSDSDEGDHSAAYVFVRAGTTWTRQQKLTADDGGDYDELGRAVSLSGDTALILKSRHLPGEVGCGCVCGGGSVYVFARSGTTWTQQAKLPFAFDVFAFGDVSLHGDTALVGAVDYDDDFNCNFTAQVFVRSGTTWTEQQKLTVTDGGQWSAFGESVSLAGDTAIVGAPRDSDNEEYSGSVYVFARVGTTWTLQQKLTADEGEADDHFGESVSLSGDTALIGSSSSAYVFVRSGTTWTQQAELPPGGPVSLSGDTALVDRYVFVRSGDTWTQQQKLTIGGVVGSVSLADGAAVFGVPRPDPYPDSGAAFVFSTDIIEVGQPCSGNDDCPSGFCTDGVCCDGACGSDDTTDCQACIAALTGGVDGVCAPATPGATCGASMDSCGRTCDGTSFDCPADRPPDGTICNDGDACTRGGACFDGVCQPGPDICGAGGGGATNTDEDVTLDATGSGCACHTGGASSSSHSPLLWLGVLGLAAMRRRRASPTARVSRGANGGWS